jgi:hypothetical protein
MTTSNILSIRFLIRKDKAKDNFAPLYARITVHNRSADISLKRGISIENWNAATSRAKGKSVEDIECCRSCLSCIIRSENILDHQPANKFELQDAFG